MTFDLKSSNVSVSGAAPFGRQRFPRARIVLVASGAARTLDWTAHVRQLLLPRLSYFTVRHVFFRSAAILVPVGIATINDISLACCCGGFSTDSKLCKFTFATVGGGTVFTAVCLFVCLSVCL